MERCEICGQFLNPQLFLKILGHKVRQNILHKLHLLTLKGPVTKKELADAVGIDYYQLIYQLNHQLKGFWKVRYEVKKRGARVEYIAPPESNPIYILLGSNTTIYVMDPLANIFGKLREVGTRCQCCSEHQIRGCLDTIINQPCFAFAAKDRERLNTLLKINGREKHLTPIDLVIACTVLRAFEGKGCVVELGRSGCVFLRRIRSR